jgi:mono/diheme cytochrome c family protein
MWRWSYVFLFALMVTSCGKEPGAPTQTARAPDANRGRGIYLSNCAACHNSRDPSKDGPTGPAIQGSPRELLEARVLKATYPPGYKPKRKTALMPAQPYLKSAIPDLAAFLGGDTAALEKNQK